MTTATEAINLWDALPTVEQVDKIYRAVAYSYEAGDMPDDMDEYTEAYTVGDGGLLNALAHLRRALMLLPGRQPKPDHRHTVRRQDGWNAPPTTPCSTCGVPIGSHEPCST